MADRRRPACRDYILRNISAEVHSGEIMGLMGPSGAGKTSLMAVLAQQVHLLPKGSKAYGSVRLVRQGASAEPPEFQTAGPSLASERGAPECLATASASLSPPERSSSAQPVSLLPPDNTLTPGTCALLPWLLEAAPCSLALCSNPADPAWPLTGGTPLQVAEGVEAAGVMPPATDSSPSTPPRQAAPQQPSFGLTPLLRSVRRHSDEPVPPAADLSAPAAVTSISEASLGYVQQHDVLMPTLTVTETILFGMMFREHVRSKETEAAAATVTALLEELGLQGTAPAPCSVAPLC